MPKNVIDATRWLRPDGSQHGLRTQIFESGDSRGTPTRISRVEFPGALSTHILSPQHIDLDGDTLTEFDPRTFFGEAMVMRFRVTADNSVIGPAEIQAGGGGAMQSGDIVILNNRAGAEFVPTVTPQAAKWLIDIGVKLVAFDEHINIGEGDPSPTVKAFLDAGVPIIRNLVNLDQVKSERVALMALPLAVYGLVSSPCRVILLD